MTERTQPPFGGAVPGPAVVGPEGRHRPPDAVGSRLVEHNGAHAGRVYPLGGSATTIGREPDCEVVLADDPTVSRIHARIVREGTDDVLYDESSTNGTFVNGMLVRNCPLARNDVIQCGATRLRYE
jgi:hypothetical protein